MGFDLNGLNPKIKTADPERPDNFWDLDKATQDKYLKKRKKYLDQEGTYFRNNVWWWRPLAEYVCKYTKVVNDDEKTLEGWHTNGGFQVSEQDAIQIANQLDYLLKSGHTKKFQKAYNKLFKLAEFKNAKIQKKIDILDNKKMNKGIAPRDYNKKDKAEWDRLWNCMDRTSSYPFNITNVKEFSKFCRASGGFEIC